MFYLIIVTFFSLLGFVMIASNPGSKLLKNKSTRYHLLNILTSFLGGFIFILLVQLFESIGPDGTSFSIWNDFFYSRNWRIGRDNFEDFIFGFVLTYIIIFIRNQYKKL